MSLETGKQRFINAVRCLVDERGPIKERLLIAYVSQLSAIQPEEDLPSEMLSPFTMIKTRLDRFRRQGDRGNAASQLEEMSEDEACAIAGDIFTMLLQLHGVPIRAKSPPATPQPT